jgi:hypothetical protein
MDLHKQINLEHLLFVDRQCRSCGKTKNLLDDFYLIRKDRGHFPSAYSYECKSCTVTRIQNKRNGNISSSKHEYPDW